MLHCVSLDVQITLEFLGVLGSLFSELANNLIDFFFEIFCIILRILSSKIIYQSGQSMFEVILRPAETHDLCNAQRRMVFVVAQFLRDMRH